MAFTIKTLHAFIATDDNGVEGVCAFLEDGKWYPMVAADPARVSDLREKAESMVKDLGVTLKLIRFSCRSDLEEITP